MFTPGYFIVTLVLIEALLGFNVQNLVIKFTSILSFIEKYRLISMNLGILYNKCCQFPGAKHWTPLGSYSAPRPPTKMLCPPVTKIIGYAGSMQAIHISRHSICVILYLSTESNGVTQYTHSCA